MWIRFLGVSRTKLRFSAAKLRAGRDDCDPSQNGRNKAERMCFRGAPRWRWSLSLLRFELPPFLRTIDNTPKQSWHEYGRNSSEWRRKMVQVRGKKRNLSVRTGTRALFKKGRIGGRQSGAGVVRAAFARRPTCCQPELRRAGRRRP